MTQEFKRIEPGSFQMSTLKLALLCVITLGLYGNVRQYAFGKILAENGIQHRFTKGVFFAIGFLQFALAPNSVDTVIFLNKFSWAHHAQS